MPVDQRQLQVMRPNQLLTEEERGMLEAFGRARELGDYQGNIGRLAESYGDNDVQSIGHILKNSHAVLCRVVEQLGAIRESVSGADAGAIKAIGANIQSLDPKMVQALQNDETSAADLLVLAAGCATAGGFLILKFGFNHLKDMARHDENMGMINNLLKTNLALIEAQRDVAYSSTHRLIQALETEASLQITLLRDTILALGPQIIKADARAAKNKLVFFRGAMESMRAGNHEEHETRREAYRIQSADQQANLHAQVKNYSMFAIGGVMIAALLLLWNLFQNPMFWDTVRCIFSDKGNDNFAKSSVGADPVPGPQMRMR